MPGRGFLVRENHRVLLTIHALVMVSGLLVCALLNRRLSPDRLWVQWAALAWGAAFAVHLSVFATLRQDRAGDWTNLDDYLRELRHRETGALAALTHVLSAPPSEQKELA